MTFRSLEASENIASSMIAMLHEVEDIDVEAYSDDKEDDI